MLVSSQPLYGWSLNKKYNACTAAPNMYDLANCTADYNVATERYILLLSQTF